MRGRGCGSPIAARDRYRPATRVFARHRSIKLGCVSEADIERGERRLDQPVKFQRELIRARTSRSNGVPVVGNDYDAPPCRRIRPILCVSVGEVPFLGQVARKGMTETGRS